MNGNLSSRNANRSCVYPEAHSEQHKQVFTHFPVNFVNILSWRHSQMQLYLRPMLYSATDKKQAPKEGSWEAVPVQLQIEFHIIQIRESSTCNRSKVSAFLLECHLNWKGTYNGHHRMLVIRPLSLENEFSRANHSRFSYLVSYSYFERAGRDS